MEYRSKAAASLRVKNGLWGVFVDIASVLLGAAPKYARSMTKSVGDLAAAGSETLPLSGYCGQSLGSVPKGNNQIRRGIDLGLSASGGAAETALLRTRTGRCPTNGFPCANSASLSRVGLSDRAAAVDHFGAHTLHREVCGVDFQRGRRRSPSRREGCCSPGMLCFSA